MFTGIEIFLYKRFLIYFSLLALSVMAFFKDWPMMMLGLPVGSLLSLLKFRMSSFSLRRINADATVKKPINASLRTFAVFMANQLVLFPLFFIVIKLNAVIFAGLAAGILTVPLIVFINGITEITGITHNNFQ